MRTVEERVGQSVAKIVANLIETRKCPATIDAVRVEVSKVVNKIYPQYVGYIERYITEYEMTYGVWQNVGTPV